MLRHFLLVPLTGLTLASTLAALGAAEANACSLFPSRVGTIPLNGETVGPNALVGLGYIYYERTTDRVADGLVVRDPDGQMVAFGPLDFLYGRENAAFAVAQPQSPLSPGDYTIESGGGSTDVASAQAVTFTVSADADAPAPSAPTVSSWQRVRFTDEPGSAWYQTGCGSGSGDELHLLDIARDPALAGRGYWYELSLTNTAGDTITERFPALEDDPITYNVMSLGESNCLSIRGVNGEGVAGPETTVCQPTQCATHSGGHVLSSESEFDFGACAANAPGATDGALDAGCQGAGPGANLAWLLALGVLLALGRRR